ncbi:gfo/Idh/MocA family oxidoreductase [Paenibacillaceae bacterium]|nr:gfo/Idh/MocA family oxidoreductase [Paenibacillaceae bacterium]
MGGAFMENKIRVLQIGSGHFGQSWLDVVTGFPDTELAGVVDVEPEHLVGAQQRTGLAADRCYTDADQAFAEVQADLVLIVTPPTTHKTLALKALQAGFHVMLEKPLTQTYEEAVELLAASRESGKQVMVSQNYRWRPAIQTAKQLLASQAIGQVGYIEYSFRKAKHIGGWRERSPEIMLEDMSIHHFDIIRYLLEKEAERVHAESFRPAWSWFTGNPSTQVLIQFEHNVRVNYFASWVSRGKETTWNGDIRIVGEKGAVEIIDDRVRFTSADEPPESEGTEVALLAMPFTERAASLQDMVRAIRTGTPPLTSIEDNIHSFRLACAAIDSATSGTTVVL